MAEPKMKTEVKFGGVYPVFVVEDVKATAEFYECKLGFEVVDYFLDPPVYGMVRRGSVTLHFGKGDAGNASPNSTFRLVGSDVYIDVDDVSALATEYQQSDAEIVEGPVDREYQQRELLIRDLNGFVLRFGQDVFEPFQENRDNKSLNTDPLAAPPGRLA